MPPYNCFAFCLARPFALLLPQCLPHGIVPGVAGSISELKAFAQILDRLFLALLEAALEAARRAGIARCRCVR